MNADAIYRALWLSVVLFQQLESRLAERVPSRSVLSDDEALGGSEASVARHDHPLSRSEA